MPLAKHNERQLKEYMENLHSILSTKSANDADVINAFYDFALFLSKACPGVSMDKIPEKIGDIGLNLEFPPFEQYVAISRAKVNLSLATPEGMSATSPEYLQYYQELNSINIGLNVFGALLAKGKEKKFEDEMSKAAHRGEGQADTDAKIARDEAMKVMEKIASSKSDKKFKAVEELQSDCKKCEDHLSKVILQEVDKNPDLKRKYEGLPNSIVVSQVAKDWKEGVIITDPLYKYKDNSKMVEAMEGYPAVKELQKTLEAPDKLPSRKLDDFKAKYNETPINKALNTNTDSRMKRFFSKIKHLITRDLDTRLLDSNIAKRLNEVENRPTMKLGK